MEDIKQYIESGILELYVLDDLTVDEKLEVERMAASYPAIKNELSEIAETMELFAEQNAVEPSEKLRASVLSQLIADNANHNISSHHISEDKTDKKIIPLQSAATKTYFYKYAFAASVALLLVSLVALFNTYNHLQESRQQLVSLRLQNQKFANQVNFQENQLSQYKKQSRNVQLQNSVFTDSINVNGNSSVQLAALESKLKESKNKLLALERENKNHEKELTVFSDPSTRFIKLKGANNLLMLIAWNPDINKLFINKKASHLPENDKDHQYQLWAIRKLKPVSLGVFDVHKTDSLMESMASIDHATAFAVTLEPRGGSEKPTLKQMMVMGITHK